MSIAKNVLHSPAMLRKSALTWSWLNILSKKRYDALRAKFGNMEEALKHVDRELLKELGCRDETVEIVLERLGGFDVEDYEKGCRVIGLEFLSIEDEDYPESLRQVPDAPVFLYYKGPKGAPFGGSLAILDKPCIACVGTREMSSYGKRAVEEFVPAFVRSGVTTISGLAYGIDAEVARQTIASGGKTVAVLGHGLGEIYPVENRRLSEEIVESGGLIISEFPLDQTPDKYTFPSRNRIIAGLSLGTIVFEAGEGSGALITSDLSLDYDREVFLVPGQVFDENYKGCNKAISQGKGKSVSSPNDVLEELGMIASEEVRPDFKPEDETQGIIYEALTGMPQSVDDLMEKSALNSATVNTALTMLELQGVAKRAGNGTWVCL